MFQDRLDAGSQLATKLKKYRDDPGIVLAVPRGGIPVAYMVAKTLGFPMQVVLTKKIGHPLNPEYAIGAASLHDYFVIPHDNVTDEYIQEELVRIRKRLKAMQARFMEEEEPMDIKGKTVIIIDDGMATGNTVLGTVQVLRKGNPAKIVIGVPVASESAIEKLAPEVDEVVAVDVPSMFYGVGAFYSDFRQVTEEEALHYLDKLRQLRRAV